MADTSRLGAVVVDDSGLPPATPEMEQERNVAIFDLLEQNSFALPPDVDGPAPAGPYRLTLGLRDRRLSFDVAGPDGAPAAAFLMSMAPFHQVIRDYFQVCESYTDAVKRLPPAQIEAVDAARRGIHDEGSRLMQERLASHAEIDLPTARRLFTLVCALRPGG